MLIKIADCRRQQCIIAAFLIAVSVAFVPHVDRSNTLFRGYRYNTVFRDTLHCVWLVLWATSHTRVREGEENLWSLCAVCGGPCVLRLVKGELLGGSIAFCDHRCNQRNSSRARRRLRLRRHPQPRLRRCNIQTNFTWRCDTQKRVR